MKGWLASRRMLLVLSDYPGWRCEDDGPRRIEVRRFVLLKEAARYFPIVRNWSSRKESLEVNGETYPVSSGNQVWHTDGTTVTLCLSNAGERQVTTVPVAWLHEFLLRQRNRETKPAA
jgi:hypothetical protein